MVLKADVLTDIKHSSKTGKYHICELQATHFHILTELEKPIQSVPACTIICTGTYHLYPPKVQHLSQGPRPAQKLSM